MANPKSTATKARRTATAQVGSTWTATIRETVESIVLALILAFLFRTFEAEAFVIPTGSMAPTLQGRHKDIRCPKCGYEYRVGASEEVDDSGNRQPCSVENVTCPMCRYTQNVDPVDAANRSDYPSYNGDRIIVNKFAYDVSDPQRWDVVVFKYPEDAKTNYIKRLVGTPSERIRILSGDIYTAPLGSDAFQIARKPPEKLRAMLQPVYDNDYVVPELIKAGLPALATLERRLENQRRLQIVLRRKSIARAGLAALSTHFAGRCAANGGQYDVWQNYLDGKPFAAPGPSLIDDFYAYNDADFTPPGCSRGPQEIQHWVGDLSLDCQLEAKSDRGAVTLELVKGGVQFRCHIDLATGEATLSISSLRDFAPVGQTSIRAPGKYDVSFSNVDERLLLSVNGQMISFDGPTTYQPLSNKRPVSTMPEVGSNVATDLSPVGIAVEDGASVNVSHLKIRRDIYYTADPGPGGVDFALETDRSRILDLQDDQFFMLGDNSPRSKDGRYWRPENYVDRRLLIGKALFVYWPHSFNYVELGSKKIPFPFWPNFERMRFVH